MSALEERSQSQARRVITFGLQDNPFILHLKLGCKVKDIVPLLPVLLTTTLIDDVTISPRLCTCIHGEYTWITLYMTVHMNGSVGIFKLSSKKIHL